MSKDIRFHTNTPKNIFQ